MASFPGESFVGNKSIRIDSDNVVKLVKFGTFKCKYDNCNKGLSYQAQRVFLLTEVFMESSGTFNL